MIRKIKKVRGWAVVEKGEIVDAGGLWIQKEKDDAKNYLWRNGQKVKGKKILPVEIHIPIPSKK